MPKLQKPGEKPNRPGIYEETGPRGGVVSNARKVQIDRKDGHLPSTQEKDHKWKRKRKS